MTAPSSKLPIGLAGGLARLGISHRDLLARAALPPRLLENPGARLDVDSYFRLWTALGSVAPLIGLTVATANELDRTEPLVVAMLGAVDLMSAFEVAARYKRMLCPEALQITREPSGQVVLRSIWPPSTLPVPQALLDLEHAFVVAMCRRGTLDPTLAPAEIRISAPSIGDLAARTAFYRCPIRTGAAADALVFRREDVHRRFATARPARGSPRPDLPPDGPPEPPPDAVDRVRAVMAARLNGQRPTVDGVARELAMSGRALQRLLGERATSFRDLLDEIRSQRASQYLTATRLTDGEIAFLLGFEEPSSFYRAFRGWTGRAPSEYRAHPYLADA